MTSDEINHDMRRLVDAHPRLFRGTAPRWSYVMPGWYTLVDKLCTDIEEVLGEACEHFAVLQIKEKFGAMRVYYELGARRDLYIDLNNGKGDIETLIVETGASEPTVPEALIVKVRELVDAACRASAESCEKCGGSAEPRNLGGWRTTLCDLHLAEAELKERGRDSLS